MGAATGALADVRILIVGAGGLGCAAALGLAAAGATRITLCDHDRVDLSNLQRQVLHTTGGAMQGEAKAVSATERLAAWHPHLRAAGVLQARVERLDADNARALIVSHDLVIDGVDDPELRYLINDTCHYLGRPLVEAGVVQWEGFVLAVWPGHGPCFRCLFPEPPPADSVVTCSAAGVLGPVAGLVGMLQAAAALRLWQQRKKPPASDAKAVLSPNLWTVDGHSMQIRSLTWSVRPDCPTCGGGSR